MFSMFRQTVSGQLFWMRLARRHCCLPAEPQVIDFVNCSDYVFTLVCRFAIFYHRASQEHVSGVHRLGCYYYLCRLQSFVLWQQRFIVPQFRPGGNDSKNHSERFRDNKKINITFLVQSSITLLGTQVY